MRDSFFDEDRWTTGGMQVELEIREVLSPIFEKYNDKNCSMRELGFIACSVIMSLVSKIYLKNRQKEMD